MVAIASVTENETLRKKVLQQTETIIADFGQLLTSVHDRLVKGNILDEKIFNFGIGVWK